MKIGLKINTVFFIDFIINENVLAVLPGSAEHSLNTTAPA